MLDYLYKITIYQELSSIEDSLTLSCSDPKNCSSISIKNNFNYVYVTTFNKCFEISLKKEFSASVRYIILGFKKSFESIVRQSGNIYVRFSYPGQFLLDFKGFEHLWTNKQRENPESFTTFNLASIEMIRRRNKPNDNCLSESTSYDDFKVKKP